jgi:hypothetical protein
MWASVLASQRCSTVTAFNTLSASSFVKRN